MIRYALLLLLASAVFGFEPAAQPVEAIRRDAPVVVLGHIRSHSDVVVAGRTVRVAQLEIHEVVRVAADLSLLGTGDQVTLVHELNRPYMVPEDNNMARLDSRVLVAGADSELLVFGLSPMHGFRMYELSDVYHPYIRFFDLDTTGSVYRAVFGDDAESAETDEP